MILIYKTTNIFIKILVHILTPASSTHTLLACFKIGVKICVLFVNQTHREIFLTYTTAKIPIEVFVDNFIPIIPNYNHLYHLILMSLWLINSTENDLVHTPQPKYRSRFPHLSSIIPSNTLSVLVKIGVFLVDQIHRTIPVT